MDNLKATCDTHKKEARFLSSYSRSFKCENCKSQNVLERLILVEEIPLLYLQNYSALTAHITYMSNIMDKNLLDIEKFGPTNKNYDYCKRVSNELIGRLSVLKYITCFNQLNVDIILNCDDTALKIYYYVLFADYVTDIIKDLNVTKLIGDKINEI